MSSLTDLTLDYERAVTEIHMNKFAEFMGIPRAALNETETRKTNLAEVLIRLASERNSKYLEGELIGGILDDFMVTLQDYGYQIPKQASPELSEAMKRKVVTRVSFYQDLLRVDGQFDNWQGLIKAKYQTIEKYKTALTPVILSERGMLQYEQEALIKQGGIPPAIMAKNPLTQDNNAVVYARREIARQVFG